MPHQEVESMDQESDDMVDNSDEFSVGSNLCSDASDLEDESPGNAAWADAMSKVLNTKISKEKFILSKARKDSDIVKQAKRKHEIELVDESGNVKKSEIKSKEVKNYKALRKEMLEKQKQKAEWEAMCRVKPDVTQKEKERELIRIATRGVVHLFNTVEKHQKSKKSEKEKHVKKKESIGAVKGTFMDILKGYSKKQSLEDDPVLKKAKQEETWNILKDDFMMGAEMKDWDKESDND